MSSAIGPGDFVQALRDIKAEYGFRAVAAGSIYRVALLVDPLGSESCSFCGSVDVGILLDGDAPWHAGTAWCQCGFRPIYRPKSDLIESLLQPADVPAERVGA